MNENNVVYSEEELVPISALQHLAFCERQWALIHLEGIWLDNRLTAEGRVMHKRVHDTESESRGNIRICRGLRLRSLHLGISGIADVIEFHRMKDRECRGEKDDERQLAYGIAFRDAPGLWTPFPVEYKRGRPKFESWDEVQLCAQGICLEEMLGVPVPIAALFYGKPLRRFEVHLNPALRLETERLARRAHELTRAGITPPPIYEKKCDNCSLFSSCMPKRLSRHKPVNQYVFSHID